VLEDSGVHSLGEAALRRNLGEARGEGFSIGAAGREAVSRVTGGTYEWLPPFGLKTAGSSSPEVALWEARPDFSEHRL
jgi:hypothetical protein